MIASLKLPFSLDPRSLQSDLEQIGPDEWKAHFNKSYYEGHWGGIALRSMNGHARQLYSDPFFEKPYIDTPIMGRCDYIRSALTLFECPLRAVRFLKLSAGSTIKEHEDYTLGFEYHQLRVHVPVRTNTEVEFRLDGRRIDMQEGECWYLDLSLPHSVANRGPTERVHLVIDCDLNDWLRRMVAAQDWRIPGSYFSAWS
jgi:hypothetical protein